MWAAKGGHSTLGIPQKVGAEFIDQSAKDRKTSVRSYDDDGRLHVSKTPISKANVCDYVGREIPDFEELGLDPSKVYKLYRHPEELAKAAKGFNNLPILHRHVPVTADDHHPGLVIGSTGTDASFEDPYLYNSLVFWAGDAVDDIEDEYMRELSCGYRYTPDMTSGKTPDGEEYDGIMRKLGGNHVALVKDGRAGGDVMVHDSREALDEEEEMAKNRALSFLDKLRGNKMAADASLQDVLKFIDLVNGADCARDDGSTAKEMPPWVKPGEATSSEKKTGDSENSAIPAFAKNNESNTTEKKMPAFLNKDSKGARDDAGHINAGCLTPEDPMYVNKDGEAGGLTEKKGMADLGEDAFPPQAGGAPAPAPAPAAAPAAPAPAPAAGAGGEGDMMAKMTHLVKMMMEVLQPTPTPQPAPAPSPTPAPQKEAPGGQDSEPDTMEGKGQDGKKAMDNTGGKFKPAMDEAINAAVRQANRQAMAIREAERAVRPYVGEINVAMDSAESIYRHALVSLGVEEAKTIHASALPALLRMQKAPGTRERREEFAMDSAAVDSFDKMFPEASRIKRGF